MASTRKNYRWHWSTIRQLEYIKSKGLHANETDIITTAIRQYAIKLGYKPKDLCMYSDREEDDNHAAK